MFDQGTVLLEVFLFDFTGDLYGEVVDVAFVDWIRPELKFDSVEGLVHRMGEDSRLARAMLAAAPDAFPRLGQASGLCPGSDVRIPLQHALVRTSEPKGH
jgi:riboflavin kinase/FMN adenylyltransferase